MNKSFSNGNGQSMSTGPLADLNMDVYGAPVNDLWCGWTAPAGH